MGRTTAAEVAMRRAHAWLSHALCALPLAAGAAPEPDPHAARRAEMVRVQLAARDITDPRVLDAMRTVPRHRFVPIAVQARAHEDGPLPIEGGQTISQPYVVAFMTQALDLRPGERVLEIGTGSGYQAAVLAALGQEVWSIEIRPDLGAIARARLAELGYGGVHLRIGDGYLGWPEAAPFDAIIVTCAPDHVPAPLRAQLRPGGRMIIPVGPAGGAQALVLLEKTPEGALRERRVLPVRFVPMVGAAEARPRGPAAGEGAERPRAPKEAGGGHSP